MSWQIVHHPLIQKDLSDAYEWYENQQKGLGERFIKATQRRLEAIALRPQSFGSRTNKKYREVKVDGFPYLISYRINELTNLVLVASIHHTKKHPRKKYRK
jgi:hypothetical protein